MSSASSGAPLRAFDRPADRIRQHRQVSDAPVVVVEGPDDFLVLRPHLPGADIFPANGKANAIETARTLLSWCIERFVCVTDRDFDDPVLVEDIASVHIPYDGRDLEAMLIDLGVLATVLEHQGSEEKISSCGGCTTLIQQFRACVSPVTELRSRNSAEGWGLAFDQVNLASKIDRDLNLKVINYCAALVQASSTTASLAEVTACARAAQPAAHRGKDILLVAGVALRRKAGSLPQAATEEPVLCGQLHSSAGYALSMSDWLGALHRRLQPA